MRVDNIGRYLPNRQHQANLITPTAMSDIRRYASGIDAIMQSLSRFFDQHWHRQQADLSL